MNSPSRAATTRGSTQRDDEQADNIEGWVEGGGLGFVLERVDAVGFHFRLVVSLETMKRGER
jgi:hypothetical protein